MDPVLGENKPHQYKPVCESHDEYCNICLKDENDPIHIVKKTSSFDVGFVEFCNKKSGEYLNKCKEIKKKNKKWFFDKEWEVMWYRASYYTAQANREINKQN